MTWWALAALGAYHGLNPAMGWLFAVSQGMQHRSRRAVLRALGPIALGHELSIALVAVLVLVAAARIDQRWLHIGAAAALIAFGIFRFVKPRAHFRWTKMRVSGRELTLWSFLMSTAHGAGLMVAPVLIGAGASAASADAGGHDGHVGLASVASAPEAAVGIFLHVAAMLAVMGVVAVVVYEKVGVEILRKAWINTDGVWAAAFVLAGVATLLT
ncbi:MAG TPA: hypothetical protein VF533_13315 [Solirubrobacteraceae bacterium]|jgi:hypothetical protein